MADLAWETAVAIEDTHKNYDERRLQVLARLDERLHLAVITMRNDTMHLISFRKANNKEVARSENPQR